MSKNISSEDIKNETLSYFDAKYLRDRGKLPAGYPMPDPPSEDAQAAAKPSRVTPLEDQLSPSIGARGGIIPDTVEDDYEEGWNNDQRRVELTKRGLSVEGKKDELIARLRRSDTGELITGDASTLEDEVEEDEILGDS